MLAIHLLGNFIVLYAVRNTYSPQGLHNRSPAAQKIEGGVCANSRINIKYS